MLEKLKSRKLWVTIVTSVLLILNSELGIMDAATAQYLLGIAAAYVLGQSYVDGKTA